MSKNILIIGGSYFVGRVFCIQASRDGGFEIHAFNRGKCPIKKDHVTEYICDRHDLESIDEKLIPALPNVKFDAVIDFCGYAPGDIKTIFEKFKGRFSQYIFISTASVYDQIDPTPKTESSPVMQISQPDPVTEYIYNKLLLEKELKECSKEAGVPYTILRPTYIYGPFNYAPRESFFIERIARGKTVPVPTDASGKFNFVYVIDMARILMLLIGDQRAYNETFNTSAPELIDYDLVLKSFKELNGAPFETKGYTCKEVIEQNIPLPFPLDGQELYDGTKLCETFNFKYTPYDEGIAKTFDVFKSLYIS